MNLIKKSFSIDYHQTSVALESEFWEVLEQIAKNQNIGLRRLIANIDDARGTKPLASSLRIYCLENCKYL